MGKPSLPVRLIRLLEGVSDWSGKTISWLNLALVLTLTYEVFSRHVLNKPTFWSYDISYMLGGTALVIGAAMTLKNRQHVRVDLFYTSFPPRVQTILDIVMSLLLLFPMLLLGFINSFSAAAFSWAQHERIMSGFWQPPIYPLKTVVPVALALLFIQALADLLRNVIKLQGREI